MTREVRPLSTYDISELAIWVDGNEYVAAYLDPATGEVYPAFEGDAPLDDDGEPVDLDETDWLGIGGSSSHAAYQDMEDFAGAVADPALRHRLRDALGGRGPFRRFRDAMWHAPEETGRAWHTYRELGAELRALEWLVDEGLVAGEDTADARATRESAGHAILQSVGGGARPRLILLNGMPGVGKSTLAERYRAEHPGVLACDPDRIRGMIGGDPAGVAEAARTLALAMAVAHLRTGHDAVVPQLVADDAQLQRFVEAAEEGDAELVLVMLVDDLDHDERAARPPYDGSHPPGLRDDLAGVEGGDRLTSYARRLHDMALRENLPEVVCPAGDVDAAYQQLVAALGDTDADP